MDTKTQYIKVIIPAFLSKHKENRQAGSAYIIACIVISIALLVFLTIKVKLHPFFALTASAIAFGLLIGHNINDIMTSYAEGLGGTISGIGVVIAIGTVMGALMEKSGGAETMADAILHLTGKKHAALGLAITGYFVSIPVFCDSAFVLLSPLAKRMSRDTATSMTTFLAVLELCRASVIRLAGSETDCTVRQSGDVPEHLKL